jgi:cellobiose phosphorylase
MGLNHAHWLYRLDGRTVAVHAVASGEHAAMQWRIDISGSPCRLLIFGHLALGERELDNAGRVSVDHERKRLSFRPDASSLWGQRRPSAVYHLVSPTPHAIEAIGGDELLHTDGKRRSGAYLALRTDAVAAFSFAVVGSMTDEAQAERLGETYEGGVAAAEMLAPATQYWRHLIREMSLRDADGGRVAEELAAFETMLPWLGHNAMMHLTVPRGLEQYTGAAWGTRDVCQGPVELLLSFEHDATVKEILRIVIAQQFEQQGDFPGWFMLEPYAEVRARGAPGDVLIWPLKALCDYVEASNDLAFLDEPLAWRRDEDLAATERRDPVSAHMDKLIATIKERFVPGTTLIRYGDGDWNDSLQPVDPAMRDEMVSGWTVALLYQQLNRYVELLGHAGRDPEAAELKKLTAAMREDFRRHLMRDGIVAGYALFVPGAAQTELLLHPSDKRTGLSYSLLPMNRGIISGLFTNEEARRHLGLIREHLHFPDGVRLMDKPMPYRGGPEKIFRRAESSPFVGREIGLMYVHAHLRYGEAMAVMGEAEALWEALSLVNPVVVTERVAHATPRQRNTYFSSSDAAFHDRYEASERWQSLREGAVPVDGGWRIYSSGPGLFTNVLVRQALGIRRHFGERIAAPVLPISFGAVILELTLDGRRQEWRLSAREKG